MPIYTLSSKAKALENGITLCSSLEEINQIPAGRFIGWIGKTARNSIYCQKQFHLGFCYHQNEDQIKGKCSCGQGTGTKDINDIVISFDLHFENDNIGARQEITQNSYVNIPQYIRETVVEELEQLYEKSQKVEAIDRKNIEEKISKQKEKYDIAEKAVKKAKALQQKEKDELNKLQEELRKLNLKKN